MVHKNYLYKGKQVTGFSINDGHNGYLRASIGMIKENTLLRMVFPEGYWTGKKDRFVFTKEGYSNLQHLCLGYLLSEILGKDLPFTSLEAEKQNNFGKKIVELFSSMGCKVVGGEREGLGFRWALAWANSLLGFYELGTEKENKKANPRVIISW